LYFLDIYWGDIGIPKIKLLSILHLISSLSIPYTWKLPSYRTSHNSISNVSVSIIVNQPFLVQFQTQKHHIWSIYYCSNFLKSSEIKTTQKECDREANTNSGRNLSKQNSWQRSIFSRTFCCSNRKVKTNESLDIIWGICTRNRRSKRYSEIFHNFYGTAPKSV
jgi:hypothetical protein